MNSLPRWVLAAIGLAAVFATVVSGQPAATGSISGRVLNQGTAEYLRNAIVSVEGTTLSTTAEAGGVFSLQGVPAGPQRVKFVYSGLDTKVETVNVIAGQSVTVDVTLTNAEYASAIKLSEFVVAAEREGNAKAIMEQKQSIESKRVLATDTFGSISEGNVGEFPQVPAGRADRLCRGGRPFRQSGWTGPEVHLGDAGWRADREFGHGSGQRHGGEPGL